MENEEYFTIRAHTICWLPDDELDTNVNEDELPDEYIIENTFPIDRFTDINGEMDKEREFMLWSAINNWLDEKCSLICFSSEILGPERYKGKINKEDTFAELWNKNYMDCWEEYV